MCYSNLSNYHQISPRTQQIYTSRYFFPSFPHVFTILHIFVYLVRAVRVRLRIPMCITSTTSGFGRGPVISLWLLFSYTRTRPCNPSVRLVDPDSNSNKSQLLPITQFSASSRVAPY